MSSNSGHLLDALRGRQPDDDDPEQRLASQWRAATEATPPLDEAALRRARQRRVVSGTGATEDAVEEPVAMGAVPQEDPEADAISAATDESGSVKRTRIVAAPEATRPQADAPRRGALERLGGVGRAVAAGLGARGDRQSEVVGEPVVAERSAAPKTRITRERDGKGRVTLSHSEAMLFVLVALVVVLSAYVIGKNNAGESMAGEKPAALSSVRGVEQEANLLQPELGGGTPTPPPEPVQPEVALGGFGVRVTSYADAAEADKQARVFREDIAPGEEVSIIARKNARGREEFHLMVGRAEKKDDPSLAALAQQFRTFARGSQKPYERSVDIQSY